MTQAVDLGGTPHIPPTTLPSLTQSDPVRPNPTHWRRSVITVRRLETSGAQIPGSPHPHIAPHLSNPAKPQGLGHSHQKGFLGSYGNLHPFPPPHPLGTWSPAAEGGSAWESPLPLHLPAAQKWCRNRLKVLSIYQNMLSFLFMGEGSRAWFH